MKITQTLLRYYPAIGGVEDYVKRLSEGLSCHGHQVTVYASDLVKFSLKERIAHKEELVNNVKVRRCYTLPVKLKNYYFIPSLAFQLFRENPDLIHGHSFMYFPADAAALVARMKRIPFIFNPYLVSFSSPSLLGSLYRKTIGKLTLSAKTVVAISNFEKKLIQGMGYKILRLEVIPPGIDLKEFETDQQENIFEKYGITNKKIILCVSRLSKSKNIETLIKTLPFVLKKIPEAILVIIGPDFGQKPNFEQLAKALGIKKNVLFLEALPRAELINAYKHADIFVFPSMLETFGIVLIEAMAARLPVVAADACAAKELVEDDRSGYLFSPLDAEGLAKKIVLILSDEKLRLEFGSNAYRMVKERYNINRTIASFLELYLSVSK